MAQRHYRVLLLEDDPLVLERLRDRLSTVEQYVAGDHWRLELLPVRVCIEKTGADFTFTRQTLDDIALAVRDGVDLVVVDYGYVNPEALAEARASAAAAGRETMSKDDVRGKILTTEDLGEALAEYVKNTTIDSSLRRAVESHIVSSPKKIPVLLYSYTSAELYDVYQALDARKNRTASAFKNFHVTPIDTRFELYNRDEFDRQMAGAATKHDLQYYSWLVSGLLVLLVRQRFLEHLVSVASSLKYIRVRRSLKSVTVLVALGAAVAGFGQWLSDQYVTLFRVGSYGLASLVAVGALVVILIAGTFLPLLFEWLMVILLRPTDEPPPTSG